MTPTQANLIEQIYLNNPHTAINARAVLALTKGLKYERYPYDLNQSHQMRQEPDKTSLSEIEHNSFKIYPNPGSDFISVEVNFSDIEDEVEVAIFNLLGSEVLTKSLRNYSTTVIDLTSLNNGIYFFNAKTRKGIEVHKLIISN